jgi:ribosomal protein L37E
VAEPITPPTDKYTGTEVCAKCGAPATEIVAGYDTERDWVQLQCRRCTNKWFVLPMDSPS